jgi:transposase InsO family protein
VVVLGHERSKVIHFDVTPNPTQARLARQVTEAFPWDTAPRFLLRDRDASYGQTFRDRVEAMAIEEIVTAPRSPWQNAYVERIIGSIRRECLDHVIIFDERHLRRVLSDYVRILGPYSHPLLAPLSPFHRSAACTIATSVAQPEPFAVTEPVPPSRCRASSQSAIASLGCRRAQNPCRETGSREGSALFE